MTKCINPLTSIEARGRIDSTVFAKNGAAQYARSHTIQTKTATAAQLKQRSMLSGASGGWSQLSDAERETWRKPGFVNIRTMQRPGKCMMKGYHYYNHVWSVLMMLPKEMIRKAYVGPAPVTPSTITLDQLGDVILVDWSAPGQPHPTRTHIQVWVFRAKSFGAKPDMTHARSIASPLMAEHPYTYQISRTGRYYVWIRAIDGLSGWTSGFIHTSIDITSLP
jgi:hypothetical protein